MATSNDANHTLLVAYGMLTLVTGLVDATSYLGLGHVFTANMTGNVVFIGFGLGGAKGFAISASLQALGGFLVGALVGGRIVSLPGSLVQARVALVIETILLSGVVADMIFTSSVRDVGTPVLFVLLGGAMGLQNATVRKLGVADMATTVLTLTLTGIAADSSLAHGNNVHLVRRLASVALMLIGALVGAFVLRVRLWLPIAVSALVVAAAMLTVIYASRVDNA